MAERGAPNGWPHRTAQRQRERWQSSAPVVISNHPRLYAQVMAPRFWKMMALLQEVYGLGEAFLAEHEAVFVLDADGVLSLVRRFSGCGRFTSRFRGGRMEVVLGCPFRK